MFSRKLDFMKYFTPKYEFTKKNGQTSKTLV